MKKLLTGFALLGTIALASAQTITFDKTTLDYGKVKPGSDGHRVFLVKNTGDKPLIISKVQPGCGCTTPEFSQDPILPGKTAQIKVGYANMSVKGPWGPKMIEVFSNDPKNGRMVLNIKGIIDDAGDDYKFQALTKADEEAAFKSAEKLQKAAEKDAKKAVKKSKKAKA